MNHLAAIVTGPDAVASVLLAGGGPDHIVHLWDPLTSQPVGDPLDTPHLEVSAVVAVPLADGRVVVATGGGDHTVQLWNTDSWTPFGQPLTGHTDAVYSLAVTPGP